MRRVGYVGFGDLGQQIQAFVHEAWGDALDEVFFDDILREQRAPNSFAFSSYSDDEFDDCDFVRGWQGPRFFLARAAGA